MNHTRKECEHGAVISSCRCIEAHKAIEVVRPCPFGDRHLGYLVVHPEYAAGGIIQSVQRPMRAVKLCVFRSCDWTIAEPDSLLGLTGLDAEIKIHLRTHRPEIKLLAEAIGERG